MPPVTSKVNPQTADKLYEISPAYSEEPIVEITVTEDETPEILTPVEQIVS